MAETPPPHPTPLPPPAPLPERDVIGWPLIVMFCLAVVVMAGTILWLILS